MLSNELTGFSFISGCIPSSSLIPSQSFTIRKNTIVEKDYLRFCMVKYLCHRTSRAVLFSVGFSPEDTVDNVASLLQNLLGCDLVLFCPLANNAVVHLGVNRILSPCDAIPPFCCCQEVRYSLLESFLHSKSRKPEWMIVNIVVEKTKNCHVSGHIPYVVPLLSSSSHIFHYMHKMLWISDVMYNYIKECPCSYSKLDDAGLSFGSEVEEMNVTVFFPYLNIGDFVSVTKDNVLDKEKIGVIAKRYIIKGMLFYDVSIIQEYTMRNGLSCVHLTPL